MQKNKSIRMKFLCGCMVMAMTSALSGCGTGQQGNEDQQSEQVQQSEADQQSEQVQQSEQGQQSETDQQSEDVQQSEETQNGEKPKGAPGHGMMDMDGTFGKVTAVEGKKISVALMEMDKSAMPSMDPDKKQGDKPLGTPPADEQKDDQKHDGKTGTDDRRPGNGFMNNMTETGETINITIDDSIEITDMSGASLKVEDLIKDTMLSITYGEDGTTVNKITILSNDNMPNKQESEKQQ